VVNDIARPVPVPPAVPVPAQAAPTAPAAADQGNLAAPNIVSTIPVHNPGGQPANEDTELDKIMNEVGQEIEKEHSQPRKHRFFGFGGIKHHDQPLKSTAVQLQSNTSLPRPAPALMGQSAPAQMPAQAMAAPPQQAAEQLKPAPAIKTAKTHSSVPFFAIFIALLVTGFLAAAAIAAYKQY
jgi:hypothetical protein